MDAANICLESGTMHKVRYEAGESLFIEGDPSNLCFKILSGEVEIRLGVPGIMKRGRSEAIATCGPGEIIGEMSVIDGGPRSATAIALEPTECMAYTAEEILEILENDSREALAYVRMLIRRIRHSNKMMLSPGARRG